MQPNLSTNIASARSDTALLLNLIEQSYEDFPPRVRRTVLDRLKGCSGRYTKDSVNYLHHVGQTLENCLTGWDEIGHDELAAVSSRLVGYISSIRAGTTPKNLRASRMLNRAISSIKARINALLETLTPVVVPDQAELDESGKALEKVNWVIAHLVPYIDAILENISTTQLHSHLIEHLTGTIDFVLDASTDIDLLKRILLRMDVFQVYERSSTLSDSQDGEPLTLASVLQALTQAPEDVVAPLISAPVVTIRENLENALDQLA